METKNKEGTKARGPWRGAYFNVGAWYLCGNQEGKELIETDKRILRYSEFCKIKGKIKLALEYREA
jgi:hypothetical protein